MIFIDNWNRDPTVLFTILVFAIPVIFTNHGATFQALTGIDLLDGAPEHALKTTVELKSKPPTTPLSYLTTPMLWLSFVYMGLVVYVTRYMGKCVKLNERDTRVANWFLMNGIYFNLFCDVVSGQFQMMDELSNQYRKVEPRYVIGPYKDNGQSVFWTSMCEIFMQSPFGILIYYGYYRNKSWRRPLEIILGVLHTAGVWWFYVPEAFGRICIKNSPIPANPTNN